MHGLHGCYPDFMVTVLVMRMIWFELDVLVLLGFSKGVGFPLSLDKIIRAIFSSKASFVYGME